MWPSSYLPSMPNLSSSSRSQQGSISCPPSPNSYSEVDAAPGGFPSRIEPQTGTILVLGLTGAGKSTLVKELTGDDTVKIGESLESETQSPEIYKSKTAVHKILFFQYLDTPGFDDTSRISLDVLEEIIGGIAKIRQKGYYITGVIYVHRILDDRVRGSSKKCIEVMKRVCGAENYHRVAVVASHWNRVSSSLGAQRLGELRAKYLSELDAAGACFTQTDSNVKHTLEEFFYRKCHSEGFNMTLNIERELNERHLTLPFTGAGSVVIEEMEKKIKDMEQGLDILNEMAAHTTDVAQLREVELEIGKLQSLLYGHTSSLQKLHVPKAKSIADISELLCLLRRQQSAMAWENAEGSKDEAKTYLPQWVSQEEREVLEGLLMRYNEFMENVRQSGAMLGTREEIKLEDLAILFGTCAYHER